jgi:uncharacterized protein YdeI (YjbR/CyaY-like superfamily)
MNQKYVSEHAPTVNDETNAAKALAEKLADALTPGLHVEFDPDEATMIGAFIEDALSEEDAAQSSFDGVISLNGKNNDRSEA